MKFRLTAQAERALELPYEERVKYVKALPPVAYSGAERAIRKMEELLAHPQVSRMPNLLLYGETNNGKTAIGEAFVRRHPPSDDINDDFVSYPVVMIQAPPRADEARLYGAVLRALYAPAASARRMDQLYNEVVRLLRHVATRVLVIDEIHNMFVDGGYRQRIVLNAIKNLGNELKIPIVCIGTHDAKNAINADPQLANRFERLELIRWQNGTEYLRLLDSFEAQLPLRRRSFLRGTDMAVPILAKAEGAIGEVSTLIKQAAIRVIESKREFMEPADLDAADYQSPTSRRG